jgi:hypothetical protein
MRKALTMFGSFALATAALGVEPSFAQVSGPGSGPGASSAPSASAAARADELFKAGMSDVKQQKWSEAEAKFAAAFSLNRSYDVAANLGQTQYRLGKYRDAAENIAFALRSWPVVGKREPRELAVKRLAELRKLVATVTIRVSAPGAMVLVDGKEIGRSPLDAEVFVEPGARVIEARLVGFRDAKQTVEVVKGGAHEVALTLAQAAASSVSTSGGAASAGSTTGSRAGGAPLKPLANETDGGSPREGTSSTSSEMRPLLIGGLVATGVAVSMGIAFAIVSSVHAADAKEQRVAAVQRGVARPCAMPANATLCEEFTSTLGARDSLGNASLWSFVVGGALGTGTLVYALTSPKPKPASAARAIPVAMGRGGGVLITGAW